MNNEVLGTVVGVIFIILGLALLTRYKKLTSHKYFRILIIIVSLILLGFGVFMGWQSIETIWIGEV
jgi:phosphotransferase system  glucose/maltose/N-acetylglucosamine-specific IIC component